MDRFFSKLDLRDIKIDPRGNRFPPDEAAYEADEPAVVATNQERLNGVHPVEDGEEDAVGAPFEATTAHGDEDDWNAPPSFTSPTEPVAAVAVAPSSNHRPYTDDLGAMIESDGDVLKVSARSRPSAVAGAIAGVVREAGRAEVQAIGAGATNQAVKAVAIARDYLRETGIEAVCLPAFIDITIDNEDRTAIRLVIEPR